MQIDQEIERLIRAGNYPKFIAYFYQLYELQKKAYAEGVKLFDPAVLMTQPIIIAAAESADIRFLQALCAVQNDETLTKNILTAALVPATNAQNFNILPMLIKQLPDVDWIDSSNANPDLKAKVSLESAIYRIQAITSSSSVFANQKDIASAQLTRCLNHKPEVLRDFIQDITNQRRNNPFNFFQWSLFVELISQLNVPNKQFIDLEAIRRYDHVTCTNIQSAIQHAAQDMVQTLLKIPNVDPDLWEECIAFFKTPDQLSAERSVKVKAFLGMHDMHFAVYTQDPYQIPNLDNARNRIRSQQVSALFQLKCAEIMTASLITIKPAPNLKAYALGQTLEYQWEKLWGDLYNSSAQWTAGWVDAIWIKRLIYLLILLNQAEIPFTLDPNKLISGSVSRAPLSIAIEQQRADLVKLLLQLPQVTYVRTTQDGKISLHLAAKNTAITQLLLSHPESDRILQMTSPENRNALFFAVEADNAASVELLFAAGIHIESDQDNYSALMYAISLNKIAVIPTLIAHLFAKNPQIILDIPNLLRVFSHPNIAETTIALFVEHLIFANKFKHDPNILMLNYKKLTIGTANLLKLRGAFQFDVNAVASDGLTILQRACIHGYTSVVADLLKMDDLEINAVTPEKKYSALHFALQNNREEITLLLLDSPNLKFNYEIPYLVLLDFNKQSVILEKLIAHPQFDVNSKVSDQVGCILTALISNGLYTLAEKLIQRQGINVDLAIGEGSSPIFKVDLLLSDTPNLPLSKLFAAMIPKSNRDHLATFVAFTSAAKRSDALVLDTLFAIPAVINNIGLKIPELICRLTDESDNPARDFFIERLLLARNVKTKATMKILVDTFQFDVNTSVGPLCTMLHRACQVGDLSFVNELLDMRSDPNYVSPWNETALKVALSRRHYSIALRLLNERNLEIHKGLTILGSIDYRNPTVFFQKLIHHPKFDVNCVYDNLSGCLLAYLIKTSYLEAAEQLLQQRPEVNVDFNIPNCLSPLALAESIWMKTVDYQK